jgi:hypothetical protein
MKAKRNDVPSGDHVARYCHPQRIIWDPVTGDLKGLFPAVFKLRDHLPKPETYISLNHFEHFGADIDNQFREILSVMRKKFKNPPEPVVARLNSGRILSCGASRQRQLRLRRRANKTDPSYVALEGLPLDNSDEILLAKLASETCVEVRSGAQIEAAN